MRVSTTFQRLQAATATWHWLADQGVRLPGSAQSGTAARQASLAAPDSHPRSRLSAQSTLRRGLCVGPSQRKAQRGSCKAGRRLAGVIPDAHPGYIDWKQFAANQAILERNGSRIKGRRPGPRQGWALLSSRVLCGRCGGRMFVHYAKAVPKDGPEPTHYAYYTCQDKRPPASGGTCQSVSARLVDPAVTREILDAVREEHIAVALAVQEEVRRHASEAAAARKQRLRQLEYQSRPRGPALLCGGSAQSHRRRTPGVRLELLPAQRGSGPAASTSACWPRTARNSLRTPASALRP